MPKPSLKNPFARRRSSGNVLDIESPSSEAPAQSSFRVIERPEKSKIVFGEGLNGSRLSHVQRPFSSPLQQLKGKSLDDLTYHNGSVDTAASRKAASALKTGRESGGTTHSGLSEFYQSSSASGRHSSSSTLPSSVDPENDDDELFSKRAPTTAAYKPLPTPVDVPLPPVPSFTARAQRAFSFGLRHKQSQEKPAEVSPPRPATATTQSPAVPAQSHPPLPQPPSPSRERALTTSSYASTAVPVKFDSKPDLGSADFGGDFGTMFEPANDSANASPAIGTHRTDSDPLFSPRTYARQDSASSPGMPRSQSEATFAWDRRNSRDGLLASAATSPNLMSNEFMSKPQTQEKASERTYQLRDPQETRAFAFTDNVTPMLGLSSAQGVSASVNDELNPWDKESSNATPRASKRESVVQEDDLFDASPNGPASRARRPEPFKVVSQPKRMTQTQFKILRSYDEAASKTEEEDEDSGNEFEDDDEIERAKQVTKQRRQQEANMAVYRQQMKKVTGGGPTDLPVRPNLDNRSSSMASLHLGGMPAAPPADVNRKPVDVDDDDIPLGYLAAQGFPSATRAPTLGEGYRPPSVAPNRMSQLPAFARRLPEDPYFGAGLVNPSHRESLAFGGGGSVYGGTSAPSTPGGLVGIIATEERQRQARRGSPNPQTGTYNTMPAMNRTSSMTSLQAGMAFPGMPGMMPPMPMTADPQMQEFMQMQMQMMSNMQAMLLQQQAQLQQQGLAPPAGMPRPMSTVSGFGMQAPPLEQSRTMSMLTPPAGYLPPRPSSSYNPRLSTIAPSVTGLPTGYTPSIAPSERSNVGMPSRYRPVQTGDEGRTNSLTSQMTLNAFAPQPAMTMERPQSQHMQQQRMSTIRVIDKPKGTVRRSVKPAQDDDEESSWGDMFRKKLKGKKSERASKAGGERVALSELYPNAEL